MADICDSILILTIDWKLTHFLYNIEASCLHNDDVSASALSIVMSDYLEKKISSLVITFQTRLGVKEGGRIT